MTKHPSVLLSAFADPEQDLFDIFMIPLITYLTYPIDFTSWVRETQACTVLLILQTS
jgi:hypothetical protein